MLWLSAWLIGRPPAGQRSTVRPSGPAAVDLPSGGCRHLANGGQDRLTDGQWLVARCLFTSHRSAA